MTRPGLEVVSDPGTVWHIGFAPDLWAWAPWHRATDSGLFDGRWDDQLGQFRTIYTASSLLGCFLELLARFRPSQMVLEGLAEIDDDDGSVARFSDAPVGAVGTSWLEGREYGSATQTGRYCFITHSRSIAALLERYPFHRHGLTARDVDTALLKDARDRVLTRSIARWLYDLRDDEAHELVDGIEFLSRHGDDVHVWAVFERAGDATSSRHLTPSSDLTPVTAETPELALAFDRFGLHWR